MSLQYNRILIFNILFLRTGIVLRKDVNLVDVIAKYRELSEEEMIELYDLIDMLYNEIKSKYLEVFINPEENNELFMKLINLTKDLLQKEGRSLEEELQLIALLDIIATDLHDRTIGFITEEGEEIRGE